METEQHAKPIEVTRYEVEITGHMPPYRWALVRSGWKGVTQTVMAKHIANGDADSKDEAIWLAEQEATKDARQREWEATKEKRLLFEFTEAA